MEFPDTSMSSGMDYPSARMMGHRPVGLGEGNKATCRKNDLGPTENLSHTANIILVGIILAMVFYIAYYYYTDFNQAQPYEMRNYVTQASVISKSFPAGHIRLPAL